MFVSDICKVSAFHYRRSEQFSFGSLHTKPRLSLTCGAGLPLEGEGHSNASFIFLFRQLHRRFLLTFLCIHLGQKEGLKHNESHMGTNNRLELSADGKV
jgi:hypothetical protein